MTQEQIEVEQFQSLRAEIARAYEDGNQIISFGFAGVGLILNAAIAARETALGFAMLVIGVPAVSSMVLSIWFGSQERIARASYFLTGIEFRMKALANARDLPTWDLWLRGSGTRAVSQHFWTPEYSAAGIFWFLMVCPVIAGFFSGGAQVPVEFRIFMGLFILVAGHLPFYTFMERRFRRWKLWLSSSFGDLET